MAASKTISLLACASVVGTTAGCAAVFRDPKVEVAFASAPPGANVTVKGRNVGPTPASTEVPRTGTTDVAISAPGYETHRGSVRKTMNGAWVTVDVLTCVFPVALCIPLLVDAITGAWVDVDPSYDATLKPSTESPAPPATAPNGAPILPGAAPAPIPTGTGPEISL